MQFNLFLQKVKLYKKQILSVFIAFFIAIAGIFVYNNFVDGSLKVLAGNFDFSYRKIPFDVEHIDFNLSQNLDKSTITKDNFVINPKIDGEVSLVGTNTIRYKFLQKLTIGDDISITLKQGIKSSKGEALDQEYSYIVSVIEAAKVLKINPEGELNNLSQNIAVFFNIPMISLTNLESKDQLPCPIQIEPKIDGTCKWTTSSVLEFIPKDGFSGATKYKVSVSDTDGLLYKLGTGASVEINTPKLKYYVDQNFSPSDGIKIRFNFAPDLEVLQKKLTLIQGGKTKDVYLSYDKANDSVVVVNIRGSEYKYESVYTLKFDNGIMPKYGNEATKTTESIVTSSNPFLKIATAYQNVFSGSKIVDTIYFYNNDLISSKNMFFKMSFEENINVLDKNVFSLEDEKGEKIDFTLSYVKEKNLETKVIKDNKKVIKLSLKQNLKNNTKYKLIIKQSANLNLESDIQKEFITSPNFELKDYKFLSYSKSCLYLNNKVGGDIRTKTNDFIESIPSSKVSSVSDYEYIDYKDEIAFGLIDQDSGEAKIDKKSLPDERYIDKGYCPPAKDGTHLYIINTRLNPNSSYKLKLKNTLKDEYGNTLFTPFEKDVKTGDIKETDKYLYISLNKEVNLIPDNLPLLVNLQTINLDNIEVEACEMDINGYIDYVNNNWKQGFIAKCTNSHTKNIKVKNNYWNLTNNKIDIEKDVIGKNTNSKFVLISGNAGGKNQFKNLFIRGNLNVTFESAKNKKLLFVTDFQGNKVPSLNLEFLKYDRETRNISKINPKFSINNENGVYEIEGGENEYNYVIVSNDKYFGIVDLDNNLFSDYDFKYVGGTETSEKNYLYLYTERPIYKPEDTVYIKGLLRKFEYNGYKKSDIKTGKLEVLDSNYNVLSTLDIKLDDNSNFNTTFIIPKDSPLGQFSFRFKNANEDYYKNDAHFYIEEYKKPDFKIDVEGLNKDYILGDKANIEVMPKYYFGGNLVSTKGEYSVLTQNYFFDAKDYGNYQFGEGYEYFDCIYWGYCSYEDYLSSTKEFSVDENGKAIINYAYPLDDKKEKIYSFNIEIEDKDTKKIVNKSVSSILHNTDGYVGIKASYYNDSKKGIDTEFVTLDHEAKPLQLKDIKVELIKMEWKMAKKEGIDGIFYTDYDLEETKESAINLKTDKLGSVSNILKPKDSGEYMIKATYTGKNGKSFVSSSIVYVASDDYISWYNPNNDTTELVSEETQVSAGNKAYYTLKSPINNGKALIIIEKDDGILDYFVHDIKSYGDRIVVPVKNSYYPNYYVRAFLIGAEKGNPLPIYKRALTSTKVSTEFKKLDITILKDKESYKPGDKAGIGIVVNDSKGNPLGGINGSISIVDESLLALVGNPKKNPYAFFYDMRRYLGTLMSSSMINLIEKLEVKDITNGEKGGAGEQIKGGEGKKKRGVFKDTAFWQADFTTGQNGKVYIESDTLPDNLTTWVVEVLANSPDDNKIGVAYETFSTTKQIIINDNLPNFFSVGDEVTLSPVIFNKTGKEGDFQVNLEAIGAIVKGGNQRKLFIKSGESKVINFDIKVDEREKFKFINIASSKINIKVKEVCDSKCSVEKEDEIEKIIQIKDSTTKESVATIGNTKNASFDEIIDVSNIKNNISQIKINYGATLFNNLVDSIDYLNNYPYGCSEQITSSVVPNVYIKKLYDSVGLDFDLKTKTIDYYDFGNNTFKKKSLDQVIKEYIVNIRKYQKNDGGFVYWYDVNSSYPNYPNYSDYHLTSYILKSLSELDKLGYKQEEKIMLDAASYLKNRFYKNEIQGCVKSEFYDCKYSELDRLLAIEAIQTYKIDDYEAYKMYKLLDIKSDDSSGILKKTIVVANLLKIKSLSEAERISLKNEVKSDINKVINNDLVYNSRGAYIGKSSSFTRIENTSMLLKTISLLGEKEIENSAYIIDNLNRWIIGQKKNGSFGSTQDNISVIDAISNYVVSSSELKDISFEAKIKLNSKNIDEKIFNEKNKLESYSKYIDLSTLKDKNTLNISKVGNGKIYYDLSMDYYLSGKNIESRDEGFAVIKEYYDYNEYKKIDSLKREEWLKYTKGTKSYNDLKYKKDIYEYLTKLTTYNVGQLVVVRNRVITSETRDKVGFEGYIPAGSELVNPNLATSSKSAFSFGNDIFEKKEYRLDRFFGFTDTLNSGIYDVSYLIRFTHAGKYYVKPSYISEFYNTEVFGRSGGEVIEVK